MGLDVCKICDSEKSGMNHQFPKIMAQPYSKLQETFKTASAVPKIPARRIRILPLKRRCSAASRYCTLTTSSSCRKCASTWWTTTWGCRFWFWGSPHPKGNDGPCRRNFPRWIPMNSTPFVRQYDILSNRWGDLLCQEENQTNDIRRNSRKWL